MSYILQTAYISILNPLYRLTGKISPVARDRIIFMLSLLIFVYFVFKRSSLLEPYVSSFLPTIFEKHLFGITLLIMLSIFSVNQPLHYVEWNRIILIPQLLMGLGMVVIGFIHPVGAGYQTFGFMLLFVFPCLYFVCNNRRDYERLFSILVIAMLVANLGLFLFMFYCAAKGMLIMDGARCAGIMGNANCLSLVGLELLLGAIYLLIVKQFKWPLFILICSSAGAGLGIMIIGQMRIAFIILFLCLLSSLLFAIKYRHVIINKRFWLHAIIGLFVLLQLTMLSFSLIQINNKAVEANSVATQESTEQTPAPPDTPNIVDRFSVKGKDANSFSSGRVFIWKNYARELNLWGHNFDEYDLNKMTGGIPYPLAHNIFLEISYRCGVPVGLLAVFLIVVTGLMALKYLFFNKRKELYLLFPILFSIAYAVEALIDCAALPFFQAEALLFYFAMIVFIDRKELHH